MTKEEIALQLALAKANTLYPTHVVSSVSLDENSKANETIGKELANLYNAIYANLNL